MTVESHISFGNGPEVPEEKAQIESGRRRKRNKRERRAERALAPEAYTIWTREDPNHLQPPMPKQSEASRRATESGDSQVKSRPETKPKPKAPQRPESKPAEVTHPAEALRPVSTSENRSADSNSEFVPAQIRTDAEAVAEPEIPAPQKEVKRSPKSSQPESLADLLKLQELPKLNIRPRHFYTEPEIRSPDTTETEHDILPSTESAEHASEPEEQAPTPAEEVKEIAEQTPTPQPPSEENVAEKSTEGNDGQQLTAVEENPERPHEEEHPEQPDDEPAEQAESEPAPVSESEQEATEPAESEEQLHAGEQLQQLAEQTAQRAAELADKYEPAPEQSSELVPEAAGEGAEAETSGVRMGKAELLALAHSIRVEGISVAEMFNAKRLDEAGLRRIVAAFLRGLQLERVVADEVLRFAMKFERDPQLRQTRVRTNSSSKRAAGRAKDRAKQAFDPKHVRSQADRLANRLADGFDHAVETAEDHPAAAKTAGVALAVIIYFVILFLIIKS